MGGFTWEAKPQYEWLKLTQYSGTLNPDDEDVRIYVTVDWKDVPDKFDEKIFIEIIGSVDGYEKVRMQVRKHQASEGFTGFVQNDKYDMHTFTTSDNASVEIHFHMTLE